MAHKLLIIKKKDLEKANKMCEELDPHAKNTFSVPLKKNGKITHYVACWNMPSSLLKKLKEKDIGKDLEYYENVSVNDKKKVSPSKKIEDLGYDKDKISASNVEDTVKPK